MSIGVRIFYGAMGLLSSFMILLVIGLLSLLITFTIQWGVAHTNISIPLGLFVWLVLGWVLSETKLIR